MSSTRCATVVRTTIATFVASLLPEPPGALSIIGDGLSIQKPTVWLPFRRARKPTMAVGPEAGAALPASSRHAALALQMPRCSGHARKQCNSDFVETPPLERCTFSHSSFLFRVPRFGDRLVYSVDGTKRCGPGL